MIESLPQSIWNELHSAQRKAAKRAARLRIEVDGASHPILRLLPEGFVLDRMTAPNLRGLVDIYDGARHLSQCLIVASEADGHRMIYEFKRNTSAVDGAPLDFERPDDAPIALLGR
ncbi:MAG: hypothetical protein AAGL89_02675 [Pseudomonadota bacterium]